MEQQIQNRFLTEREVSVLTGFSLSKVQQDRFFRRGIPYCKVGRSIRYSLEDVLAFMDRHKIRHGDE